MTTPRPVRPGGASFVRSSWRLGRKLPELAAAGRVAELAQRLRLDLPDPLAGEPELASDLLQRASVPVVEPEAQPQDPLLTPVEAVEHRGQLLLEHPVGDRVERRHGVAVLDQVTELGIALVAHRRLERDGLAVEP